MISYAQFMVRGPEFVKIAEATIQAALDAAELRTDAAVFDTLTDDAHYWLAAHLAAASPQGREARLSKDSEKTLYLVERERLETICGGGWGST